MRLWVPLAIFMLFHACSSLQSGSGSQRGSNNRRQWSIVGSFRRWVSSGSRQSRSANRNLTPSISTGSYRSDDTHAGTSAQGASGPARNSQRWSPPRPSSRSPHARPQAPTVGDLATDGMLLTVQAVPRYQVPDVELRRGADITVNPQPQSPRQAMQLFTKEKNYNRVTLLSALRWVIYHLNDAAGPPMLVEISFGRVPRGLRKMRWIRRTALRNLNIDSSIPIRRLPESFESLNNWLFTTAVRNNIERAQNPLPPPPLQPEEAPDDRRVSSSDPNACRICFSHAEKIWIKPCNHRTCKSCILTIRKEAVEAQRDRNASYKCPFCKGFVEEWKEDGPYPKRNPNAS